MLLLAAAGLVILENPKTATQSMRAMLREDAHAGLGPGIPHHITVHAYLRDHAAMAAEICGGPPRTLAVVRAPMNWLESWFRYRSREKNEGTVRSTRGTTFSGFLEAMLAPDPPVFARIGRQARFTGWTGHEAEVDHLFDHARLDLLVDFLSSALGRPLSLPALNVSPPSAGSLWDEVSAELSDRVAAAFTADLELYSAVSEAGHLRRNAGSPSP